MSEKTNSSEKLKSKIEELEIQLKDLTEKYSNLLKTKNNWSDCAFYYAEKFQMAYIGYLMTKGFSEERAHQESLKVLDKIQEIHES